MFHREILCLVLPQKSVQYIQDEKYGLDIARDGSHHYAIRRLSKLHEDFTQQHDVYPRLSVQFDKRVIARFDSAAQLLNYRNEVIHSAY